MRRPLSILLLALLLAQTLQSQTSSSTTGKKDPEPYKRGEFPEWALDLRRAEAVAFGSLPFTVFATQTIVETYRSYKHGWDPAYAPWPVKSTGGVPLSSEEFARTFAIGCVGAVVVAAVDYFIVTSKRRKARRAEAERPGATYTVERAPIDQSEVYGETPIPVGPPPAQPPAAPGTP